MSIRSIGDDDEEQGRWENLPQELLRNILIKIVRWGETFPPERAFLILPFASVCKSWRVVAKEIVKTIPELSQQLIFPISLKQPGLQRSRRCLIKRNRDTSICLLYLGTEARMNKRLLAAKRKEWITHTSYAISLVSDDFRPASNTYVGELRSNLLRHKFTIHDIEPGQVDSEYNNAGSITYKMRRRVQRRIKHLLEDPSICTTSTMSCSGTRRWIPGKASESRPASVKIKSNNNDPKWDPKKCSSLHWHYRDVIKDDEYRNFIGRFRPYPDALQLAYCDERGKEKRILKFARTGREDEFMMEYRYPLSAFQAFAIFLSHLA